MSKAEDWIEDKLAALRKEIEQTISAQYAEKIRKDVEKTVARAREKLERLIDLDPRDLLRGGAKPKGSTGQRECSVCGLSGARNMPGLAKGHSVQDHKAFREKKEKDRAAKRTKRAKG